MEDNKNIKVYLNTLRQKGYLAYEYNPFHNYQTNVNLYKDSNGKITEDSTNNNLYATAGSLITWKLIEDKYIIFSKMDIYIFKIIKVKYLNKSNIYNFVYFLILWNLSLYKNKSIRRINYQNSIYYH